MFREPVVEVLVGARGRTDESEREGRAEHHCGKR
jgi:hypothetical protein